MGLISTLTALAQSSGSISGQVTDSSKAVMPGAKVIVKSVQTGVPHNTTTNREGYYVVPALPPEDYIVSASFEGFKTSTS